MTDQEFIDSQDYSHAYTTPKIHVERLYKEVVERRPRKILELGTFQGLTAVVMARAQASVIMPDVHTVDLNDQVSKEAQISYIMEYEPLSNSIRLHPEMKSIDFLRRVKQDTYDLIFHDSVHGFQAIPEYFLAWNSLPPDGTLIIHDWNQVQRWSSYFKEAFGIDHIELCPSECGRILAILQKP